MLENEKTIMVYKYSIGEAQYNIIILKSSDPKVEPCGTPQAIACSLDLIVFSYTNWDLFH